MAAPPAHAPGAGPRQPSCCIAVLRQVCQRLALTRRRDGRPLPDAAGRADDALGVHADAHPVWLCAFPPRPVVPGNLRGILEGRQRSRLQRRGPRSRHLRKGKFRLLEPKGDGATNITGSSGATRTPSLPSCCRLCGPIWSHEPINQSTNIMFLIIIILVNVVIIMHHHHDCITIIGCAVETNTMRTFPKQ